jgi:PAS domain S-box-containing protein
MAMNNPVLILYLEDNPRDVELLRDKLQQLTIPHELRIATGRAQYEAALAETRFDLIISDYALPDYDGLAALALALDKQPDVPFILISGTLSEEQAVDSLHSGATDYVSKQNLKRLVPAVLRALTEAEGHQRRRAAETALQESTQMIEGIIDSMPVRVFWKDKNLAYLGCNATFARDAGFAAPNDLIGKDDFQMVWREQAKAYRADDRAVIESGCAKLLIEESQTTQTGDTITLLTSKLPLRNSHGEITGVLGMYMDITERKRAEMKIKNEQALSNAIIEGIPGTFYMLDENGKYVRWSAYQRDEIVGKPDAEVSQTLALDTIHPDDRALILSKIE